MNIYVYHICSRGEEPGISKQQEDKVKPASGDKYRCLICMVRESHVSITDPQLSKCVGRVLFCLDN